MKYLKQMVECSFKNRLLRTKWFWVQVHQLQSHDYILIMSRFEESLFCTCNLLLPPVCWSLSMHLISSIYYASVCSVTILNIFFEAICSC